MTTKKHRFVSWVRLLPFLVVGLMAWPIFAQQNREDTIRRSQELQKETAPSFRETPTVAEAGAEDEEFGELLTLKPNKRGAITPYVRARGFWTSNALLSSGPGEKGDSVWMETEGVDASYRFSPEWLIFADYNFSMTRYDENPFLDSDANNTSFGTSYKLPFAQDLRISAGIRGLWITSPHQEIEVYRECNPYLSLVNVQHYLDNKLAWFYGYEFDKKYTNPLVFERIEHTIFTGVGYEWLPTLSSQAVLSGNWQIYDFRPPTSGNTSFQGRQEHLASVSLETVWQPLSWLQIAVFGSTAYDNSINRGFDYKVANVGGEVRGFYKFDFGPAAVSNRNPKSIKLRSSEGNIGLNEPVNRTLEMRAGPRFGQVFGSARLGQTGTDFDFGDDLSLNQNFVSGSQLDIDWQAFPKFHIGFQHTYDRYDQRGHTTKAIFKGGEGTSLPAGSVVDGTADLNTVAVTLGYDVYKDKTWIVTPFFGAKWAFLDEELFVADANNRFTLSGKGTQEILYATPLLGAEIKSFVSRSWYLGVHGAAFGLDQWNYVHGQVFTGYDFSENWGTRLGFDVNFGSYENAGRSLKAEGGIGSLYLQAVYGF
ncbi:MAG: hypothetical protein HY360_19865 [Verrucomicrobia bacterium]|nr:hypothetical protein [Verrucomicrobiota bacterium]